MSRTAHTHSVPPVSASVKGTPPRMNRLSGGEDAQMLLTSILTDPSLRRSALGMAVLAALVAYGAASSSLMQAPIRDVAADLETTYDSVYKRLRFLAARGYVQLSHVASGGQQRLFLRLVWPQTKPTTTRRERRA